MKTSLLKDKFFVWTNLCKLKNYNPFHCGMHLLCSANSRKTCCVVLLPYNIKALTLMHHKLWTRAFSLALARWQCTFGNGTLNEQLQNKLKWKYLLPKICKLSLLHSQTRAFVLNRLSLAVITTQQDKCDGISQKLAQHHENLWFPHH